MMFEASYSLLSIFDKAKRVSGRKKIQKMVHLLESSGANLPFKYTYHHYGPYSANLQEEINHMVEQGFLTEKMENETYVYAITSKGREFKELLETKVGYKEEFNWDLMKSLNKQNSQFLEVVSTYAFLLDSGYSRKGAKSKTLELKPHLGDYIDLAVEYFHSQVCSN